MIHPRAGRVLGAAGLRGARPAPVDAALRAACGARQVGPRRPHRGEAPQERQRLGVHRDEAEGLPRGGEGGDAVHRAGLAVAERLRRELQRKAARRASEPQKDQGSSPTSVRRSRSRRTGGTSTTMNDRTPRSATLRRRPTRRGLPPLRSGLRPSAPRRQARNVCFRCNQPDSHSARPAIGGRPAPIPFSKRDSRCSETAELFTESTFQDSKHQVECKFRAD
jgi:hypothetical protein